MYCLIWQRLSQQITTRKKAELLEEMWRQLAAAREASAAEIDLSTRHDQRTDEQIPTR